MINQEYKKERSIMADKFRKRFKGEQILSVTVLKPGCVEVKTKAGSRYICHYKDAKSWQPNMW